MAISSIFYFFYVNIKKKKTDLVFDFVESFEISQRHQRKFQDDQKLLKRLCVYPSRACSYKISVKKSSKPNGTREIILIPSILTEWPTTGQISVCVLHEPNTCRSVKIQTCPNFVFGTFELNTQYNLRTNMDAVAKCNAPNIRLRSIETDLPTFRPNTSAFM